MAESATAQPGFEPFREGLWSLALGGLFAAASRWVWSVTQQWWVFEGAGWDDAPSWFLPMRAEFDGNELPLLGGLYLVGVVSVWALLALWARFGFGAIPNTVLVAGSVVGWLVVLQSNAGLTIRTEALALRWVLGAMTLVLVLLVGSRWRGTSALVFLILFSVFVAHQCVVFSFSSVDVSFLLGPGLRMVQGDWPRDFFMQYPLLPSFLTGLVAKLFHGPDQLPWLFVASNIAAFCGLAWLAPHFIKDRTLRLAFLVACFLLRFVCSMAHPVHFPQTSALRFELWLVPVLFLAKRGPFSAATLVSIGALYLCDNSFGALIAAGLTAYCALHWVFKADLLRKHVASVLGGLIGWSSLVLLTIALNGAVLTKAASFYRTLQLGMLPVSTTSIYWAILAGLLAASAWVLRHASFRPPSLELVPLGLTFCTLPYFWGRSHDNSLFTISTPMLLLVFLALDQASRAVDLPIARAMGLALVSATLLTGAESISADIVQARAQLTTGKPMSSLVYEPHAMRFRQALQKVPPRDMVFIDPIEPFFNSLLGFPQEGTFGPLLTIPNKTTGREQVLEFVRRGRRLIATKNGVDVLQELFATPNEASEQRWTLDVQVLPESDQLLFEVEVRNQPRRGTAASAGAPVPTAEEAAQ
jgi:hypothetical protein